MQHLAVNKIGHGAGRHGGAKGGSIDLAAALADASCALKNLDLGSNRIGRGGCRAICRALSGNRQSVLAVLSIANNGIEEYGAMEFSTAIQNGLPALTDLNIAMNKIGDRGAVALAAALLDKPGMLQSLNLRNNFVGDDGAKKFANLLVRRQVLISLDLSCNNIGFAGGKALIDGLHSSRSMLSFLCRNNPFDIDERIVHAMEHALDSRARSGHAQAAQQST
eukprot:SAG31_NODE_200_length_20519_cov_57.688833_10_plen_222_part_00